ncbi:uncharacterized protein LOC114912137 isoform X1 [Scleropages formosus]|nr:uncharacterized protein LOC114912137 isoform X1 [Scleropages formosus]
MAANKPEKDQRKRLAHFLSDLAVLGSLQGFRYFQPWLRGREELLLTVVNEDKGWCSPGFPVSAASSFSSSSSGSSGSPEASRSSSAAVSPPLSASRCQEAHLLPASPSEKEIAVPEMNCTLFLLAGYAKYGRPYAWIRSNHERLINIGGADSLVRDTPMKLKSITDWPSQGTQVWDIVSELVGLCTVPPPANPFALDMNYVQTLALSERFLVSGALVHFLEALLVHSSREEPFYRKVLEEVEALRRLHVQSLGEVQQLRGPKQGSPEGRPRDRR